MNLRGKVREDAERAEMRDRVRCAMVSRGGCKVHTGMDGGGWAWEQVRLETGEFLGVAMMGGTHGP